MALKLISKGSGPNQGDGDTLRQGADKINDNFSEVYVALGVTNTTTDIGLVIEPGNINTGIVTGTELDINGNADISQNLSVTGISTFSSLVEVIDDEGLYIKSETNSPSTGARIRFSDKTSSTGAGPFSQYGEIKYKHSDDTVVTGYNDGFVISGTEAKTALKLEGDFFVDNIGISTDLTVDSNLSVGGTSIFSGISTFKGGINLNAEANDVVGFINLDTQSSTSFFSSLITFRKSRDNLTPVEDDDILGALYFSGYNGSAYVPGAAIESEVNGTPNSGADTTDMPANLLFKTSPDGTSVPVTRLTIASDGNIGISTNLTVDGELDVNTKAEIDNVRIDGNEIDTTTGDLTLDSNSGKVIIDDNVSVAGTSIFSGISTFRGGIYVDTETNGNSGFINLDTRSTSSVLSSILNFRKSGNDLSAVLDEELLGMIQFSGYNGSAYRAGAQILSFVDGEPNSGADTTDMPANLVFATSPNGTSVPVDRMIIASDGNVDIVNDLKVDGELDVNTKAEIDNVRIDGNTVDTTSGNLTLDSNEGKVIIDDNVSVAGTSIFSGISTFSGGFINVSGATNNQIFIENQRNTAAAGPQLVLSRSRAGLTAAQDNDRLGQIFFQGYHSNGYGLSAQIVASVDGTPSANSVPGLLEFITSDGQGSSTTKLKVYPYDLVEVPVSLDVTNNLSIGGTSNFVGISTFNEETFFDSDTTFKSTVKVKPGTNGATPLIELEGQGSFLGPYINFFNSDDDVTAVQDNQALGSFYFSGYNGSGYTTGAIIETIVDGNLNGIRIPTRLTFKTSSDSDVIPQERLTIRPNGDVEIAQNLSVDNSLTVSGISTFSDEVTFIDDVYFGDIQVGTETNTGELVILSDNNNPATRGSIDFRKSSDNKTAVTDDHRLGEITFSGYSETASTYRLAATIEAKVDGEPDNTNQDMPGELIFSTSSEGSSTPTDRMLIRANGDVEIVENLSIGGTSRFTGISTFSSVVNFKPEVNNTPAILNLDTQADNSLFDSTIIFNRSRNNLAPVEDNDTLGNITFKGYNGSTYVSGASIQSEVDGEPNSGADTTDMPANLLFKTSPDGTSVPVTRLTIASDGDVDIVNDLKVDGNLSIGGTSRFVGVSTFNAETIFKDNVSLDSGGTHIDLKLYSKENGTFNDCEIEFFRAKSNQSSLDANILNELGTIRFRGLFGSYLNGATIQAITDNAGVNSGTTGTGSMPTKLVFSTSADTTSVLEERLVIRHDGTVEIPGNLSVEGDVSGIDATAIKDTNDAVRAQATTTGVEISGDLTFVGSAPGGSGTFAGGFTGFLKEKGKRNTTNLFSNNVVELSNGMVHRYTTTFSSQPAAPNIKYAQTPTPDSIKNHMQTGDIINITLLVPTNNASVYLFSGVQQLKIDGDDVTTYFAGGARPTAGGSSGIDIYNITIIRDAETGNASDFTAIVSQTITVP